jgi:hypothetical protein
MANEWNSRAGRWLSISHRPAPVRKVSSGGPSSWSEGASFLPGETPGPLGITSKKSRCIRGSKPCINHTVAVGGFDDRNLPACPSHLINHTQYYQPVGRRQQPIFWLCQSNTNSWSCTAVPTGGRDISCGTDYEGPRGGMVQTHTAVGGHDHDARYGPLQTLASNGLWQCTRFRGIFASNSDLHVRTHVTLDSHWGSES